MKRRNRTPGALTREQTIEAMLRDGGLMAGVRHEALKAWPEAEREEIFEQAREEFHRRRSEQRRPELLRRLAECGPEHWGSVFAEDPSLREELTFEQRTRWRAWLASRGVG